MCAQHDDLISARNARWMCIITGVNYLVCSPRSFRVLSSLHFICKLNDCDHLHINTKSAHPPPILTCKLSSSEGPPILTCKLSCPAVQAARIKVKVAASNITKWTGVHKSRTLLSSVHCFHHEKIVVFVLFRKTAKSLLCVPSQHLLDPL